MSQTQPADEWRVVDYDNNKNVQTADSKADAEEMKAEAEGFGSDTVVLVPPGEPLPEDVRDESTDEIPEEPCGICGEPVSIAEARSGPGGQPIHGECYGEDDSEAVETEVLEPDPEPATDSAEAAAKNLPERSVADDPLTWMPGDFIDEIDGTMAINRKGYEVLSHFYDVDIDPTLQVAPEETDHEYCRVKCKATTADGREVAAFGSAHVERGDAPETLLEYAGTRARKRALSIATGVGAVAVEELKNEAQAEMEASD